MDPRAPVTTEGLQARFRAARAAAELQRAFMDSAGSLDAIAKELEAVNARIKERPAGDAVTAAVKEFSGKVDDLKERFKREWGGPKFLIFDLAGQLQASTSAPTEAQIRALDQLTTRLTDDIGRLNVVVTRDLPELRTRLSAAGVGSPVVKTVEPPKKP